MAKRLFTAVAQTFTQQAVTTALTSATYMALLGGSVTQMIDLLEVLVSGMASASTVAGMGLYRCSTNAATATVLAAPSHDGPMVPATAALGAPPFPFVAATTGPQASAVVGDAVLNLSLNLFGGIIRWNAAPTQQWQQLGTAADVGTTILFNSSTGGGAGGNANAHIMYEPY